MADKPKPRSQKRRRPRIITARVNDTEHAAVLRTAEDLGCSISEVIRRALFPTEERP